MVFARLAASRRVIGSTRLDVSAGHDYRGRWSLFSRFEEYVTGEHTKKIILSLCEEFRKDLIVVLDGAPYFRASAVTDLTARDDLTLVRLPAYYPYLNPVEECWRQLRTAIDTALEQLSMPDMRNYF